MFFLSDVDPNAKVRGARDPLGTQSIWSGFGRLVVGNLTTQTTSLDDFRVLLIGAWLTDRAAENEVPPSSVFVAWEQIASYARASRRGEGGFRGVTRVQARLGRAQPITVSSDRAHQTLTNQAAYGIWGLYTAAASRCGVIESRPPLLSSDSARALIDEHYLPILTEAWGPDARELLRWVARGAELRPRTAADGARLEAVARCICDPLSPAERSFFRTTVVEGGHDNVSGTTPPDVRRRQALLASLLRERVHGPTLTRRDVETIAASTDDDDLAEHLEAILACESVLAPAMTVFSFVAQQPGAHRDDVIRTLDEHFRAAPTLLRQNSLGRLKHLHARAPKLLATLQDDDGDGADRWLRIAGALHDKEYDALVGLLLQQNELVSKDRGGAVGWVGISPGGIVDVRLPGPRLPLPDPDRVGALWFNGYFLTSLLTMTRAVEAQ